MQFFLSPGDDGRSLAEFGTHAQWSPDHQAWYEVGELPEDETVELPPVGSVAAAPAAGSSDGVSTGSAADLISRQAEQESGHVDSDCPQPGKRPKWA